MESASTAASAGALLLAGEWPRRTQRRGTNGPHGIEQKRPPGTGIRLAWLKLNKGATTQLVGILRRRWTRRARQKACESSGTADVMMLQVGGNVLAGPSGTTSRRLRSRLCPFTILARGRADSVSACSHTKHHCPRQRAHNPTPTNIGSHSIFTLAWPTWSCAVLSKQLE